MHRVVWISVLCAIVLFGTPFGCGPDFDPYWKINKLRVMAIQADPVVANHQDVVTLSALVYAPEDRDVEYDWSWCPVRPSADDEYECPVDSEDLDELSPDGDNGSENADGEQDNDNGDNDEEGDDPFDLGDDAEAVFFNFFEEEQVRQFCEAIQQQFLEEVDDEEMAEFLPGGDCEEGYEVTVRLEVSTEDDSIVAAKRFKLSGGADEQNENPVVEGLEFRPADADDLEILRDQADWDVEADAEREVQWTKPPEDGDLRVVEGVPIEVRTAVDPESIREYTPSGADEPREEAVDYRYFTTTGNYNRTTQVYSPGDNTLDEASNVELSLSSDEITEECREVVDDGCRVRVWSVVRDNRLGVDWGEAALLVVPEGGA